MSDTPEAGARDWRDTVFLPQTDFPMKAGLAAKEPAILAKWQADDLYGQLREARAGAERFILHDGPPYANGDIHMGHAMNKVLKDIIVRSQSLLGKDAPYVPGWDCHGLPIEWKIEEEYRKQKRSKDEVPAAEFRAQCRAYAAKWLDVQREQFQRLGVMGDWADPYVTMDFASEAAIAAELLTFAEAGTLYRGAKPVMWSPVEKTALAEAEVEYEDIVSTQIDVAFEIIDAPNAPELVGAHAVIWTTTPWTIPVNQALAYSEIIPYSLVSVDGRKFVVAYDLIPEFLIRMGRITVEEFSRLKLQAEVFVDGIDILRTFVSGLPGQISLLDATARHPMYAYLRHSRESGNPAGDVSDGVNAPEMGSRVRGNDEGLDDAALAFYATPRPFLPGGFVTTDQGTGLVHMAPDHGEDDFLLCKAHGINPVFAVEGDGRYRADWGWLGGQGSVINPKFNAPDGPICSDLRAAGALLAASADYQHSYPHSWRSKAKVIFRATPQWFIPMDRGAEPLRNCALSEIETIRWVPEKAKNRIAAMVEGRPDWVISRQRAWGVPIALFIDAQGNYLRDPAVNTRIVAAFAKAGADAWFDGDPRRFLGNDHDPEMWTPVTDILDVWFDSGSTHAFVVEARYGIGTRADLYVEGSDQHRGWFQSSLLESCGTRGVAPYGAVLTHGFALDGNGRKMSKSLGNVVDPLKIIGESGADILRMWVASTDYFEDVRIGKEVLAGASDAYRKLRNTFRYLLGALAGFGEAERVDVADMPELERYVLHRLAALDGELRAATADFAFSRYLRALTDFAQDDLSAFFFDIRKDSLYCDAEDDPKRRAYRTVLDTLFHALVRYAAPIIPFTAEEVWGSRYPEAGSVHLLTWPEVGATPRHSREGGNPSSDGASADTPELDPGVRRDDGVMERWARIRAARTAVTEAIEPLRRDKTVRSSLEADVTMPLGGLDPVQFAEICIVSDVRDGPELAVTRTDRNKCGRCWRHLPEVVEDGDLCARCAGVVGEGAAA